MEPVNLDPSPGDSEADTRLEALLRAPRTALPDDGFSTRILTALPERQSAPATSIRWSRTTRCGIAALFSTLAALAGFAVWGDWAASWPPVIAAFDPLAKWSSDPIVLSSLVIAIASSFYALRRPARRASGLIRLD